MASERRARAQRPAAGDELLGGGGRHVPAARLLRAAVVLALIATLVLAVPARAGDPPRRKGLVVASAPSAGHARASVAFAPGDLASAAGLCVFDAATAGELPTQVLALSSWPDGSVQVADVSFAVGPSAEPRWYWAVYGDDVRRTVAPVGAAAGEEVAAAEGEVPLEIPDATVGTLMVRVEPDADWYYWGYLVPTVAVLGLLVWRKRRLALAARAFSPQPDLAASGPRPAGSSRRAKIRIDGLA